MQGILVNVDTCGLEYFHDQYLDQYAAKTKWSLGKRLRATLILQFEAMTLSSEATSTIVLHMSDSI